MELDRLTSTAALISAIRRDVTSRTGMVATTARIDSVSKGEVAHRGGAALAVLRRQLAGLAREVDVEDPTAVRQARMRFIRAVLVWEFGPELREHPEWRPLMEGVEEALAARGDVGDDEFVSMLASLK
ncbi:hypothetical protein [Stenotrophomonas acidaminiphila]